MSVSDMSADHAAPGGATGAQGGPADKPPVSLPGEASRVFGGLVGRTYPAFEWPLADLLIDRERFESEGNWAFCRFDSPQVPAVRMGFQAGSFAIGAEARSYDPERLQLHLEVMTADGGHLWVPTGRYPASAVRSDARTMDISIAPEGREIVRISGWPDMDWHIRSDDDAMEVRLAVDVRSVTILPDSLLPHAVFGMWETMGRAVGRVRVGDRGYDVAGHVFFDHTRIVHRPNAVEPRRMYLYTTLAFSDGSGLFGYHAEDAQGRPVDYYCFGVHVTPDGSGTFLPQVRMTDLVLDGDGLPSRWRLAWEAGARAAGARAAGDRAAGDRAAGAPEDLAIEVDVSVPPLGLVRAWGAPSAPRSRSDYIIFPLVLEAAARVRRGGESVVLEGSGLAEYYDDEAWKS